MCDSVETQFTEAQTKLLQSLLGQVGKPRYSGIVYIGIGSPQDRVAMALEAMGVVSRKPLRKQGLVIVKGAWV